jgi:cephalosporin hydroxylase
MIGGVLRGLSGALAGRAGRTARHLYARLRYGRDLPALATYFGTDKWGSHWYAQHYQTHFAPLRRRALRILEIGVGGYQDPSAGGESLRMWKAYFPNARIIGLDFYDKRVHDEDRIRTVQGSQIDAVLLQRLSQEEGPFDIVIDDGSHVGMHVLRSFEVLFPLLKDGGFYVIEDTQSAYWPELGGSEPGAHEAQTSMGLVRRIADAINYREWPRAPGWQPDALGSRIVALHCYHNMAFILKGRNDEPSNVLDRE